MKKPLLFLFFFSVFLVSAQVKIGENADTLDATSILELESTSRALVITRLTTAEMEALRPLEGAIIYNEDESCIFYYNGTDWNNLCDAEGESTLRATVWGEITGSITDQVDLAGELAKYVDLTSVQEIAGKKTFTEKLTVNTGDTDDQAAEFLGRVKGEEGTAPEDFVTKAQLDASGGSSAWGGLTGTLTDQLDLADEFTKYVDLTSVQEIAGEKTFSEKFTVNTGATTDQAAEFLGRVKGEDGTAPEDFVTKAQLDASGGSSAWGDLTGTLTDQLDLADEFAKYVDLTSVQEIAGEKTFTEKFTVNTGATTDQAAEFLGRVKGEEGTAPEDFVTKAQLDASSGDHTGTEGSLFFAGETSVPTEDNDNLFWNATNKQLRVGAFADLMDNIYDPFTDDLTTLSIQGSVSTPVDQATTLTEEHHTIIISWNTTITLPNPRECYGRMYIVKIKPGVTVGITGYKGYNDSASETKYEFIGGTVTQLQSNGYAWEQIN